MCSGLVGGVVNLPIYAGEIQARQLGVAAYAFDEQGEAAWSTRWASWCSPSPCRRCPWASGATRTAAAIASRISTSGPGVWRHGDFFRVNARGGCFVLGRSDATLNRHGVRIGTAEVYRSLLGVPEVEDSLIVNLDLPGGRFFMPLFVKLKGDQPLDEDIESRIRAQIRSEYSPRHVPGPDLPGAGHPIHADRQEDGGPGAPDPHGCTGRKGRQSRCNGQRRMPWISSSTTPGRSPTTD